MKFVKELSFVGIGLGIGILIGALIIWQFEVAPLRSDFDNLLDKYGENLESYDEILTRHEKILNDIETLSGNLNASIAQYKVHRDTQRFTNELVEILLTFIENVRE